MTAGVRRHDDRRVHRAASLAAVLVPIMLATGSVLIGRQSASAEVMPLSAMEGRRYERITSDADGKVIDRAVLDVGSIAATGDTLSVPVSVVVYEKDVVTRRFSSTWTCATNTGTMLMSLLVFGDDLSKPSMRLEAAGTPVIYPAEIPAGGTLPDLAIEIKVRQGFLRFLAARTRLTLRDRRLAPASAPASAEPGGHAYTIVSRVELRAYAWGIRVKRARFESEETIDPDEGLLRHVLKREDGRVSTLRQLQSS